MGKLTHCHTIGQGDDLATQLIAALSFIVMWGLGEVVGPLSPLLLALSARYLPLYAVLPAAAIMAYPFVVPPESLYSPRFCRFVLAQAGWLKGGASLWASDDVVGLERLDEGVMVAYHPHGLIPCGFCLNGAIRGRARDSATYLPSWLPMSANVSGVQAPVLFRIPLLRHILLACGCCVPATKAGMRRLFAERVTFGIVPGGSEEVAIHEPGRENLYLRKRAGFLKYALQHGYTVVIAFSFGESDLYSSVKALRPLNLWLVKKLGFVLPIFCGSWFCPLLPRRDVPLHTVFGKALVLPKIEDPTPEQVETWHATYMRELEAVFERHKAQFGYEDRKITFF